MHFYGPRRGAIASSSTGVTGFAGLKTFVSDFFVDKNLCQNDFQDRLFDTFKTGTTEPVPLFGFFFFFSKTGIGTGTDRLEKGSGSRSVGRSVSGRAPKDEWRRRRRYGRVRETGLRTGKRRLPPVSLLFKPARRRRRAK